MNTNKIKTKANNTAAAVESDPLLDFFSSFNSDVPLNNEPEGGLKKNATFQSIFQVSAPDNVQQIKNVTSLTQKPKLKEVSIKKPRSSIAHVPLKNIDNQQYTGEVYFGNPLQKINMQFDTGSAIVYVLTDRATTGNKQEKFKVGNSSLFQSTAIENDDDARSNRIEYGYGSGYINGYLNQESICFSADDSQPCVQGIKILESDEASGVDQDRFAGIIGLAPRSSEKQLQAFVQQVH